MDDKKETDVSLSGKSNFVKSANDNSQGKIEEIDKHEMAKENVITANVPSQNIPEKYSGEAESIRSDACEDADKVISTSFTSFNISRNVLIEDNSDARNNEVTGGKESFKDEQSTTVTADDSGESDDLLKASSPKTQEIDSVRIRATSPNLISHENKSSVESDNISCIVDSAETNLNSQTDNMEPNGDNVERNKDNVESNVDTEKMNENHMETNKNNVEINADRVEGNAENNERSEDHIQLHKDNVETTVEDTESSTGCMQTKVIHDDTMDTEDVPETENVNMNDQVEREDTVSDEVTKVTCTVNTSRSNESELKEKVFDVEGMECVDEQDAQDVSSCDIENKKLENLNASEGFSEDTTTECDPFGYQKDETSNLSTENSSLDVFTASVKSVSDDIQSNKEEAANDKEDNQYEGVSDIAMDENMDEGEKLGERKGEDLSCEFSSGNVDLSTSSGNNVKAIDEILDSKESTDTKGDRNYDTDSSSIAVDEPSELCDVILEESSEEYDESSKKHSPLGEHQDDMEFIQVDSKDKDESSDLTENCIDPIEKDPIDTANELSDTCISNSGNEREIEIDDSATFSENTVTREQVVSEKEKEASTEIESNKEECASKENTQGEGKSSHDKSDINVETITGDKPTNEILMENSEDGDEEICIIPDTVPRIPLNSSDLNKGESSRDKTSVGSSESEVSLTKTSGDIVNHSTDGNKGKKICKTSDVPERTPEGSPEKESGETRRTPGRPQRQAAKKAESQIKELADDEADDEDAETQPYDKDDDSASMQVCGNCFRMRVCKFQISGPEKTKYFCSQDCFNGHKKTSLSKASGEVNTTKSIASDLDKAFTRKCAQCSGFITGDEKNLSWETMDFCNEDCLGRYQKVLGSQCANCKGNVAQTSLGKYCVRFGYDVKQFCCSLCLEEFKKGLKVCSYCQKDISSGSEGFLAPVGDKGQFKDFCTQSCMEKYDQMSNHVPPPVVVHQCAVCNHEKVVVVEVMHNNIVHKLCSEPCFAAFKFVNGIAADQCFMCKKYFDKKEVENYAVYSDDAVHNFCCKMCMNVYILGNRKIVPCQWCKVKKYNFDMIKRVFGTGQLLLVCSLNCLTLYQVSMNAISSKRVKCDMCSAVTQAQYHLTMSDATVRNFCNYQCVMQFQSQYSKSSSLGASESTPVPTGAPKRYYSRRSTSSTQQTVTENKTESAPGTTNGSTAIPVISSVTSLAPNGQAATPNDAAVTARTPSLKINNSVQPTQAKSSQVVYKQQVIFRPSLPKTVRNKSVSCRPYALSKGVSCRPQTSTKETQTEAAKELPALIPVPVPIYVPCPMLMYSSPFPVPVPFPLPIPVPIFIPTTRNSASAIMKDIKRIQDKIPTDPFEAEILMMAEIVAGEKKRENSESDSEDGNNDQVNEEPASAAVDEHFSPEEAADTSNTFGEDMLQMALKMATELEEPADLEAALTPSTITPQTQQAEQADTTESEDDPEPVASLPETRASARANKKRGAGRAPRSSTAKRRRLSSSATDTLPPPPEPPQPRTEAEKPDANMSLKYTFGVNAWKQWVLTKNAELEKAAASNRKLKLFKPEILQLTADELNYSLCLFVKEVRKPNGSEYAPDTIYYLCLGIQQYLYENGRIDNIFTDPYYEKFTECLDEVAKKFTALYNDSQFIVTRVEEEHLWESKQLGAHSPHVLLSTLMFFNTKHFNLTTVEEHMQLSFSHIMKHWKRSPNQAGTSKAPGGSRNVLLRFYPPQSALEANTKKKKVYEQQENEENPLRCPVKLYEFYLSKCPESVKTRNDVFYLLPERSCVPDSPVWYSTMALGKEPLVKMLNRVKMVKEINIALLTS